MTGPCVLVTGGAGYIGSHMVLSLRDAGRRVVVLDDLSMGTRSLVPSDVAFVEGDVGNAALVRHLIRDHAVRSVIHFAGSAIVAESMADPLKYYKNNTAAGIGLIDACTGEGIQTFVHSSTCAVYGVPDAVPIGEDAPTRPISPYGASKLALEWALRDVAALSGMTFAILRYFNVAGADPAGRAGQISRRPTHLMKIACEAATGKRGFVEINGDDYATPDGTCVRDYVHVSDLAELHRLVLQRLEQRGERLVLNCGYGHGYSVREIIDVVARVAGMDIPTRSAPRRPGDPPELVADTRRLFETLGWRPCYDDIEAIARTALAWERRLQKAAP
jgi:UDP-glucose 4-epimerase